MQEALHYGNTEFRTDDKTQAQAKSSSSSARTAGRRVNVFIVVSNQAAVMGCVATTVDQRACSRGTLVRITAVRLATCRPPRGLHRCRGKKEPARKRSGQHTGNGQCVKDHNRASRPGYTGLRPLRSVSPTDPAVLEDSFHAANGEKRSPTSYILAYAYLLICNRLLRPVTSTTTSPKHTPTRPPATIQFCGSGLVNEQLQNVGVALEHLAVLVVPARTLTLGVALRLSP